MTLSEKSTDQELMLAYQNGDPAAFDTLFKRHSPKVYGFLVKQLKSRTKADDIFQATFLKLHQSRRLYDPKFPFAPWLFMICKSALIDEVRKDKRNFVDLNNEAVSDASTPEETSTFAGPDISSLPDQQRAAIEMRYSEELSFTEIAERLKTSPTNARKLISRGLQKLKNSIGGRTGNS